MGRIDEYTPPATPRRPKEASKPQRPSKEQQQIAKKAFDEKLFPIEQYLGDDGKPRYRRLPISSGIPLSIPPRKDYYLDRPSNSSAEEIDPGAIFGILVNPKSGHPMFAVCTASGDIKIFMTDGRDMGQGEFDGDPDYRTESYGFSTAATGFPRVHTSQGVQQEGGGFGTVLYSALCLASHLDWIGAVVMPLAPNGIYDGISSMPNKRSEAAEAWWSAAKMRFNLAYEVMATNTITGVWKPCDVYEYKMLLASNMVVAWSPNGPETSRFSEARASNWFSYDARGDGKRTAPGNRKALVNMNVSTLSLGVFNKFLEMAIESGATKKELDGMEHRFRTKTDIKWDPNKSRKAPVRRETAASSGLSWIASGQTREGLMRAAEMPEEYERLAQERLDLGWPFMDD